MNPRHGSRVGDDPFLSDDPAYWSALRDRIVAAGTPTVDAYGSRARSSLEIGGRAAAVLAACAVLAVLGSWAVLPPSPGRTAGAAEGDLLARALLPDDPLAEALIADQPPSLAALLGAVEGR